MKCEVRPSFQHFEGFIYYIIEHLGFKPDTILENTVDIVGGGPVCGGGGFTLSASTLVSITYSLESILGHRRWDSMLRIFSSRDRKASLKSPVLSPIYLICRYCHHINIRSVFLDGRKSSIKRKIPSVTSLSAAFFLNAVLK